MSKTEWTLGLAGVLGAAEEVPAPEVKPAQKNAPAAEVEEDIFADMPVHKDAPESRRFVVTGTPAQINELRRAAAQIGVRMHEVL